MRATEGDDVAHQLEKMAMDQVSYFFQCLYLYSPGLTRIICSCFQVLEFKSMINQIQQANNDIAERLEKVRP